MPKRRLQPLERFWELVDKSQECWLWLGALDKGGYGWFNADNKHYRAHRYAYFLAHGSFPEHKFVCHKCDNPRCVRPDHLFAGTHTENIRDMVAKGRKVTRRGEERAEAKLSDDQVIHIRTSKLSGRKLAKELKVSEGLISMIRNRKRWAHV